MTRDENRTMIMNYIYKDSLYGLINPATKSRVLNYTFAAMGTPFWSLSLSR